MSYIENKSFFTELTNHSFAKVQLLQEYITPWIRKVTLGCNSKCLICDTFAGEGIYEDGTLGSPMIILKSALEYLKQPLSRHEEVNLVFIEADKESYLKLKHNLENELNCVLIDDDINKVCENLTILISNSTHESLLEELLESVPNLIPSLFFVDPFGFKGISFNNLKKLLTRYNSCEVIINFMYEEFNRFKSGANIDETLTNFFGSDVSVFKEKTKYMNPQERRNYIIREYKNNFINSGVRYTLDFDIQKDDSIAYKMSLIFASNNLTGFNVMKNTMLNLCKNIYFEYRTHENKTMNLFSFCEMDLVLSEMANVLYNDLKGQSLTKQQVELYCKKHEFIPVDKMAAILRLLAEDNKIIIIKNGVKKLNPKRFPNEAIIEFSR